ncbi:hypothetical protein BGZ47_002270, partial [Haplosporangium gracile]
MELMDELMSFSIPARFDVFYTNKLEVMGTTAAVSAEIVGYDRILFARLDFYDMLLKKTPLHKVHMSKKVSISFGNGTTARGDILIGADGVHSTIRKHLYKTMGKQGLLSHNDTKEMSKGYTSLVGTTNPLDLTKYLCFLKDDCESVYVIGDKDTPYNTGSLRKTKKMMNSIRHFKTPYGTLGDSFDGTPDDRTSKIYFKDMLFETWNHDRTVLIGD